MAYKPISSYGVIGNLQTAALIGEDGSLDWFCLPRFDSPSIFARILDDTKGGHFTIAPRWEQSRCQQLYKPDTNVLVTRFMSGGSVVELTDFMPMRSSETEQRPSLLVRRVKAVSGSAPILLECAPAFHYATQRHHLTIQDSGATFNAPDLCLYLSSPVELKNVRGMARAEFVLEQSETISFVGGCDKEDFQHTADFAEQALEQLQQDTERYWQDWLTKCTYEGRWRGSVHRSALLLELLTYAPSGAIIAAPTCSLPEWIGS